MPALEGLNSVKYEIRKLKIKINLYIRNHQILFLILVYTVRNDSQLLEGFRTVNISCKSWLTAKILLAIAK